MVGWLCFLIVLQNSWHTWRFMPDYVEEGTEAEIGAAANIEPWLT